MLTVRLCGPADVPAMFSIINDGARAYQGVILADRWHEPYMLLAELEAELGRGVVFWGCESGGELGHQLL